jgi:hypothetical protein
MTAVTGVARLLPLISVVQPIGISFQENKNFFGSEQLRMLKE